MSSDNSVPSFTYSTLPPNSYTRMIRLLPDENKSALIQCELFNYNLSQSGDGGHLYEALSYVWGSPARSHSIILNGCRFYVTESLYTALLHLRDNQLERVLWIDAISIKQHDDQEKSKQIPLMRKIYAQARRVVVWLGEAQEYGDKALEVLGSLGRKQNSGPINEKDLEKCEKLLQRDWFRRIWVLQEVGVAQYISIMCGSVQINGHLFCEGVNNLKPSSTLMARISPVSFLIKGAIFRSHDEHYSTATLSMGELVSMYRNHNATKQHDKVYALLGLSSDSNSAALIPDYELPWHEVFRQVTQHVFPKCSVETWCGSEIATVKGKGRVLGYIYSISDSQKDSQQTFQVVFNQTCQRLGYHDIWETEWSLQASGELLQGGDIICLLEGHSEPSILRLCSDYYVVVTPVVRPKEQSQHENHSVIAGGSHSLYGLYDILLVWKVPLSEVKNNLQSPSNLIDIAPNYHEEDCEAERRQNHITSNMLDAAMKISELGLSGKEVLDNLLFRSNQGDMDTE
ncbi:HET-domain-containing protein [Aspergillus ellipticus CBS 707.79]|uniref:HET-domain-containing protein n=1 Tax=Aspergillus ellipticus CBS 707.79 TaxID=1448320 RepID=A0A319EG04_9EURO|nr:HET-domain-containing protein [Aspergillus ellipticus CBS 707.79]